MVSIINSSTSIRRTLLYNELKVGLEKALFLGAFNYLQESSRLSFDDKLQRFRDLTVLNERSRANTLHISLNFHPADELHDKKLRQIASEYMQKIGFGKQPYLVYRHMDAGHPHLHVVTTNIRPDGSRIPNDGRAPRQLAKICSGIERSHHLIQAMDKEGQFIQKTGPAAALKLLYGRLATKTGIEEVLDTVLEKYKYTSLEELNALLSLYNVRADRGVEGGIMYKNRGLYYRMIDENGKKTGAPVKASAFDSRPILDRLEKIMSENVLKKQQSLSTLKTAIDWRLIQRPQSLGRFMEALKKERVQIVIDKPKNGKEQDFFYVDFRTHTICKGSTLGDNYTARAILERSGLDRALLILAKEQHRQQSPDLEMLLTLAKEHDQLVEKIIHEQHLHHRERHSLRL